MAQIKVSLVKSLIGAKPKHKKTAAALGLRKMNSYNLFEDTPVVRGKLNQVRHLVKVEQI